MNIPSMISSYLVRIDKDILAEKLDKIFNEDFKVLPGDQEIDKLSREEARALELIESSIVLNKGRYTASAPWRQPKGETSRIMDSIDSGKTAKGD